MMVDKNIVYCLYFVSFRDNNAAITGDITRMIETVQAQGLQLFNIRLGPIDKETVNTLVSETLVSAVPYSALALFGMDFLHYSTFHFNRSCHQA